MKSCPYCCRYNDYCQEENSSLRYIARRFGSRLHDIGQGRSGLSDRSQMHFAEEALRPLEHDQADGVSNIFGREHFCGIFQPSPGKLGCNAAGTDKADADAEGAQVFGHASSQTLKAPL